MLCPKCRHPQKDGLTECEYCGVIFAKIPSAMHPPQAAQGPQDSPVTVASHPPNSPPPDSPSTDSAPPASAAPRSPAPQAAAAPAEHRPVFSDVVQGIDEAPDEPRAAPLPAIAAAVAVIAATLWWLNFPSGLPLGQATYVNQDKAFALAPPADWLMLTRSNYKEILKQYSEHIPKELHRFVAQSDFEISFVKIADAAADFSPSFNVVAMPLKRPLPPLTETEKETATKMIGGEMEKVVDSYELVSAQIIEVDRLKSLELKSTASLDVVLTPSTPIYSEPGAFGLRQVEGHTEAVTKTFEVKTWQTLIPGNKWAYILSCSFETADPDNAEQVCRQVLDSFRVTNRPPRYGSVVMGALNGGLIAAGLYLLHLLGGRLRRRA